VAGLRRAFLGVVPPPPVLDSVEQLLTRSRDRVFRWTTREQWHITIQYLGRVADPDALSDALRERLATVDRAPVQLRGGGAFTTPKRAQVFWLGVDDVAPLERVYDAVAEAAGPWIAARDLLAFRPHLTLARLRRPTDLTADVAVLEGATVGPPWVAEDVVLFESDTRPSGAVYTEIGRFPLTG
jgi:2'-5' RNA ligase